uniref:Uncharacterized protein n=1 Tax=Syphacia muris TaxID=451379 RepID=A0A0N5APB7_9BILA
MILFVIVLYLQCAASVFGDKALKELETGTFGIENDDGKACLLLKFGMKLFFVGTNNTWKTEKVPSVTSKRMNLDGHCAANNSRRSNPIVRISWSNKNGNTEILILNFKSAIIKSPVKQLKELRWQMDVSYLSTDLGVPSEYKMLGSSVSAPLNQKYICRDRINVTLQNSENQRIIVELQPDISIQPYNIANKHANLYICERTKRRTLTESFNNRMTIFSGLVLGISSVGMLVGYSFKRQLHPSRQHLYQSFE